MILSWLKKQWFARSTPRELRFVFYTEADKMLSANEGWRIAPEEDRNQQFGFVYLERPKHPTRPALNKGE